MNTMEPVQKYNLRKRHGQPLHLQLLHENVAIQPKTKRKRVLPPTENPVSTVEVSNHVRKQPANSKQRRKPPARSNTKKPESQDQDEGTSNKRNNKRPKPAENSNSEQNKEAQGVMDVQQDQIEPPNLQVVEPKEISEIVTPETENSTNSHKSSNEKGGQKGQQHVNKKVGTESSRSSASQKSRKTPKKTPTTSYSLNSTQNISPSRSEQAIFIDAVNAKLKSYVTMRNGDQGEVKAELSENEAQSSDDGGDNAVASGSNVEQMDVSSLHDQSRIRNLDSALLAGDELNVSLPLHLSGPVPVVDIATLSDGNIKIVERKGNQITINCKLCCKNYTTSVPSLKKAVEKHMQKVHNPPAAVEGTNASLNVSLDKTHSSIDQGDVTVVKVEDVFSKLMDQTKFNNLLMNYVIIKRLSTTVTEDVDFKLFIGALVKGTTITIPTPQHLLELLEMRYIQSIAKLRQQLKSINHICISADLFTKDCRTYLALMCHFIDPITFQRHSKALVFHKLPQNRQFTNSYMYNEVREIILDKFDISQDKVVRFMCNSVLALSKKRGTEKDLEGTVVLMNLNCNNNFRISSMKFSDRQDATQMQCYAHKLERLAAHYVLHCLDSTDASLKLMQFWDALQNAPNIEATFVDTIFCSATLQCPQSKKYHLSHLSFQDVLECVETALKLKTTLNQAMKDLKMSPFVTEDFTFFEELILVMKPVLLSLLVMRRKENCYLGIILPTLRALQFNLKQVRKMSTNCEELRVGIMGGIERRFTNIIDVKSQASQPLVLATMSLPQWKQTWLRDISEENREFCKELLIQEVAKLDAELDDSDPELVSEDDEFFDALRKKNEQRLSQQRTTEVCRFLEDDRRKIEIIDQYPRVKRVFLKYNTILPTSTPLANFLCNGKSRLLTPFNCGFPDKYFEMLFVLRNEIETETN